MQIQHKRNSSGLTFAEALATNHDDMWQQLLSYCVFLESKYKERLFGDCTAYDVIKFFHAKYPENFDTGYGMLLMQQYRAMLEYAKSDTEFYRQYKSAVEKLRANQIVEQRTEQGPDAIDALLTLSSLKVAGSLVASAR